MSFFLLVFTLLILTLIDGVIAYYPTCGKITPDIAGQSMYRPTTWNNPRNPETYHVACDILQVDGLVYKTDPLLPFRQKRGLIDPASMPHILSNPYRLDGTGFPQGYPIPNSAIAHRVPVFSEGNNWPLLEDRQTNPDPYIPGRPWPFFCGICVQNLKLVTMSKCSNAPETLTQAGLEIVSVHSKINVSMMLLNGMVPGSEQPGQMMTIINPGQNASLPVAPQGWLHDLTIPEQYFSVAGLDPLDAVTWHHNSCPGAGGGARGHGPDLGTAAFAYDVTVKLQSNNRVSFEWSKNEGFDPNLTPDPEYGLALYFINGTQPLAINDIHLLPLGRRAGPGLAQQKMWVDSSLVDSSKQPCFNVLPDYSQFLTTSTSFPEGTRLRIELITHSEANSLLVDKSDVRTCQYAGGHVVNSCGIFCPGSPFPPVDNQGCDAA